MYKIIKRDNTLYTTNTNRGAKRGDSSTCKQNDTPLLAKQIYIKSPSKIRRRDKNQSKTHKRLKELFNWPKQDKTCY